MSDKKKLKNLLDQGLISEEEYAKGIQKAGNSSVIKIGVGVLAIVLVLILTSNSDIVNDQPSLSVSEPVTESKIYLQIMIIRLSQQQQYLKQKHNRLLRLQLFAQ